MIALLCTVLSAYLSIGNDPRNIPFQIILLWSGLLFYQAALSAYFIIFLYILINKISGGEKLLNVIKAAKYWIYTMCCTAILYLPIAFSINYCKRSEKIFEGSCFLEYLGFVQQKIFFYFENIYSDWKNTHVGAIVSVFIIGFVISLFVETWKNRSNYLDYIARNISLSALVFAFFLAPIGVTIFFNHAGSDSLENVPLRIIYTLGIVISLAMCSSSLFFEKIYFFRIVHKIFSIIFVIWNIVFTNAAGNLLKQQCQLHDDISRNIAEDLYNLQKSTNNNISAIEFLCHKFTTTAAFTAKQEYPILERILVLRWGNPLFCNALLKYNGHFLPRICNVRAKDIKTRDKKKVVDRMWYVCYLVENNTMLVEVKKPQ
jgi:hypothetical protein